MTRYIGLIDGTAGAYGIHFPDLPGCTGMGDTIEETVAHGADALRVWLDDALAGGELMPTSRDFESLSADPDVAKALADGSTFVVVQTSR